MIKKGNILIIDDDETILDSCSQSLIKVGYSVKEAKDGAEGLNLYHRESFHVVLLDLKLPGIDGLGVLSKIHEETPETPVIIITGYASIESAVEAMRIGAFDYLAKPFSPRDLRFMVDRALKSRKILLENLYLRQELDAISGFDMVVGKSKIMERVLDLVKKVSPSESTVLITGESGTGKEILAREIHKHSLRRDGSFVVVDCGALVESLFESELFGHVKGSFTGAYMTKHGRFEVADGGTIFLDEISNISLNIQTKLLRVIQEREVTRVGSSKPIQVDARIIAATNEDLAQAVQKGKFREDLFYRLSVVPIHIPPLRERKEDIPQFVDFFLKKYNKRTKKSIKTVSVQVKKALMEYDWPGNIRELENTIERAVVLSKDNTIDLDALIYHGIITESAFLNPIGGQMKTLEEVEKEYIRSVLQASHGIKNEAARILGVDRKTLWAKIKKYHLT
ncbi:MAG: sigma-54 dependent transcriptional regulator [Candidatus Aminicenantes bacterium]|nr:sigma-54 dependent transcriptional regulator [Candidatus Aminicenantes bacterium]